MSSDAGNIFEGQAIYLLVQQVVHLCDIFLAGVVSFDKILNQFSALFDLLNCDLF